jgi:hypothetical protein
MTKEERKGYSVRTYVSSETKQAVQVRTRRLKLRTVSDYMCKLPGQVDSGNGELLTSSWARYVAGDRPANASWGRSSL